VFNADGQPVPRLFEHEPPEEEDIEGLVPLGLVPLFGEQADQPEQLRLLLRSDAAGTTFEYETPEATDTEQAAKPLAAYIVDAREVERRLEALDFEWTDQPQGFIGKVRIEDSNNLQSWRNLASATLADLDYEDTAITQNRVNLARQAADYLRITWQDMPADWALSSVSGVHFSKNSTARRDSISLDGLPDEDGERETIYDIGGYPPADRVKLLLGDENVVLRASILYRLDGQERWRQAHSGLFYNIKRQGNQVQSPPASMNDIRARHWKVRIDSGVTASPPRLELGWHPDRLEQFPQQRVLGDRSIFRMLRESGEAGSASLGSRIEIAGASRLEISPSNPLRVAALWLGLIGAILLVGWLVWSLSREMRQG
jgi:hypothetical protein